MLFTGTLREACVALDARNGALRWTFHSLPPEGERAVCQERHAECVGEHIGVDTGRQILVSADQLAEPQFLRRRYSRRSSGRDFGDGARYSDRQNAVEPAARPSRHLGPRHEFRADADRHHQGRQDHPGAGADVEAGLSLCPRPHDRRAGLSDRGAPGLDRQVCQANGRRRRSLMWPSRRR